jgi:hypothetical protein
VLGKALTVCHEHTVHFPSGPHAIHKYAFGKFASVRVTA